MMATKVDAQILIGRSADTTAPTVTSVTIPAAGTTVEYSFSENVDNATGASGLTLTDRGGAATLPYSSGNGTGTLVFT